VVSRLACQSEWIINPTFPESAGKGQERYKAVARCEACQNEWINGPPVPESAGKGHSHLLGEEKGVISTLARRSKWIIDPPCPESAGKSQG